jgi:hypothetical protein
MTQQPQEREINDKSTNVGQQQRGNNPNDKSGQSGQHQQSYTGQGQHGGQQGSGKAASNSKAKSFSRGSMSDPPR